MDTRILREFIDISSKDSKAEFECSILGGLILTKDVADRIQDTIKTISLGSYTETSLLRVSYPQNIRVEVQSAQLIQKVVAQKSFKGIPLIVQRKTHYPISRNTYDYSDMYTRFRLREEETIRKDWDASPEDQRVESVRLINRRSYKSADELFSIDFSMIKSRQTKKQTLSEMLKTQHVYELEIEFIKKDTKLKPEEIIESLQKLIKPLIQTYQQSEFILTHDEQQKYLQEFRNTKLQFYSPVTLLRRHLSQGGIWKDYTVTIPADGDRWGLYVT